MPGTIQSVSRGVCVVAIAGLLMPLGLRSAQPSPAAPPAPAVAGLGDLFTPAGGVLQDRNGDGVIDFVNARIALGPAPTASEVSAGADIAARLGFETSAMDIPLAAKSGAVVIAIGAAGARAAGLDRPAPALAAGEGLVESAQTAGGGRVIAVLGGDDAGTRAAGEWLAGRLPHVWDPNGPTLDAAAADVRAAFGKASVNATIARVAAVRVHAGAGALERIDLVVSYGSPADATKAAALRRTPLSTAGVKAVRVATEASPQSGIDIPVAAPPAPPSPVPPRPGAGAKDNLTLANAYAIDGLLGDSDTNLIPDRLDVLLSPAGEGTAGTVDVAARLGLESTGVTLPIALPASEIKNPASMPTLVLIGVSHPLVDDLVKAGRFVRPDLQPGDGLIQVVRKAFGEKSAMVVTGADTRGLARALAELSERLPHVWARGKDRTTIGDVQEDVRRFLAGRTPAGQAAMALYKLDTIAETLRDKDLQSATVKVSLEKPAAGFADFVRKDAATKIKAGRVDVEVENRDVQHAKTIFSDAFDIPSEVDDFWTAFRGKVLPAVRKGQPVAIEARLSEGPEVRAGIEKQAREELARAGADPAQTRVTILSAYKQGYSWLYDVVRPQLAGKGVDRITIRFARIDPIPGWEQQAMLVPTRWLQELFPIDEILARELKIDKSRIQFEERPAGSPTYDVVAAGTGGAEIFHGTFDPKFVVRPFFDVFPTYEKVRVTTGWLSATVRGQQVADERIETDPERFWDHFQAKTLTAIYAHEMKMAKGKPRPEDAPFFGELTVDLTLSEPNYRLGLGNEQIASLESVQEEVYFNTLHFFDVLGREARGPALDYVGRVIPIVRPKQDGKAGHASITFTGFDASRPSVIVDYVDRAGTKGEARLDIPKIATEGTAALAARVKDGQDGLESLDVRIKVDTAADERAQFVKGTAAEQVDQRILSAAQARAVVEHFNRLREAGMYRDALAYHDLRQLRLVTGLTFDPAPAADTAVAFDTRGEPPPWPDIKKLLPPGFKADGSKPLVQWDTPIPPPEGAQILATMSTFPEATVYKVGETYLGKDSWAMDLMPPVEASHWSQAKQSTLKPTIVYSARQDANEVSSTSHTLKLAELLLTDPQFKPDLKKVNVVFHPFTNPDGAQLAYDLYKITPDNMLHPGYLGSLGVSLVSRWDADPMYPESRIRPNIWRTWLPDIFLNPHGYPSHEWVQLFSEYVPWVRNRVSDAHGWWAMRGWFIPGFNYLDDPKYPRNKDAVMRIRQLITRNLNAVPQVKAFNEDAYARYRKYTGFDEDDFKMEFTDGVLIYTAIKGAKAGAGGRGDGNGGDDYMTRQPNITIFFGSTEAPDETAYGDWMKLVATMGLQWDKALLESLLEGRHVVERKSSSFFGGVALSLDRAR
ncbi:MAG TPA: M14 family metallopeptidase, partial [Vicinamibacterales bacterium]|nr:M14 family metallopeptidase [Vicinamibacterales bacterium]